MTAAVSVYSHWRLHHPLWTLPTGVQVRMSKDGPEGPFWSALASFATRTCYANTACDHLVGWANASLRQAVGLTPDAHHCRLYIHA